MHNLLVGISSFASSCSRCQHSMHRPVWFRLAKPVSVSTRNARRTGASRFRTSHASAANGFCSSLWAGTVGSSYGIICGCSGSCCCCGKMAVARIRRTLTGFLRQCPPQRGEKVVEKAVAGIHDPHGILKSGSPPGTASTFRRVAEPVQVAVEEQSLRKMRRAVGGYARVDHHTERAPAGIR